MKYLLNSRQMKEIDRYSIEEVGIPALILMERAALRIAKLLCEVIEEKDRILFIFGMGNNGGDAVAAARILAEKGITVGLCGVGDEEKASEQLKKQLSIARTLELPFRNKEALSEYTIIVDGIFGIGLAREVAGEAKEMIEAINTERKAGNCRYVVSVDMPSGVSADDGRVFTSAVKADATVTFGYAKRGLYLYPGCEYAGRIQTVEIGFPKVAEQAVQPDCFGYEKTDLWQLPVRKADSHKGTYGKLLIVGGAPGMSGACIMAAKAALKMGVGLVKVVASEENRIIIQSSIPEAMFSPWEELNKELLWADGVVLGPGLGQSEESSLVWKMVWEQTGLPLVVDADAINLLAKQKNKSDNKRDTLILTPHLGEMARLTGKTVKEIKENLCAVAKSYAKAGEILLLKDARSVVSDGKQLYLNLSGHHALAKGGSGDVLAGMTGALLVQKMPPFEAACLAAYIHGLAAEHYVETKSAYSLLAGELVEELAYLLP